jgi:CheY-like chemotaxis protein
MDQNSGKVLNVLVVDDSPIDRIYHATLLRELGHEPRLASDVWEALEMLEAAPSDVVLMDMRLPDMDGLGALRRIRAMPPPACEAPVIVVTALLDKEDRKRCLEAGVRACLPKPLEAEGLAAALAGAVGRARVLAATAAPMMQGRGSGNVHGLSGPGGAALCRDFLVELDVKQRAMDLAMARGRQHELAQLAHALAGGAAILGLRSLVEAARRLDNAVYVAGRRLDGEDMAAMFAAMQEARQVVEAWLAEG